MKETKTTLSPEMLGAISQAKQILAQLNKSGMHVQDVNIDSAKGSGLLFEYMNAIHDAIVNKEFHGNGPQEPSPSSPSLQSRLSISESVLVEVIRKAVMDSEKEREDYVSKNGGFSYALLYSRYLEVLKANGSQFKGFSAEYHTIINQYREIIEKKNAGELDKFNNDRTLSGSIDGLTQTLAPLIDACSVSFWTFVRKRLAIWKKLPRWRNPYTYLYIAIGLMFSVVLIFEVHTNHQLKNENKSIMAINYEYQLVDIIMSGNETYQKERTKIHESIQNNGLQFTWEQINELRSCSKQTKPK